MLDLLDELGEPFEGTVPNMEHGELTSAMERLSVRYSRGALTVTQQLIDTPARVEQVAPRAWSKVASALNLERQVVRCGARFILHWPVSTIDIAREAMVRGGLIASTPLWEDCFGRAAAVDLTTTFHGGQSRRSTRAQLATIIQKVKPAVPANLSAFLPETAIQLDLDLVFPSSNPPFESQPSALRPFSLGSGALKDFIRESWEQAKRVSNRIRQALGDLEHG